METVEIVIREPDRARVSEIIEPRLQQLNLYKVWFPKPTHELNTTEVRVYTRFVDMETAMLLCYTLAEHFEPVWLHNDVWDDYLWNPILVERGRPLTLKEIGEEDHWLGKYQDTPVATCDEC